MAANGVIVWEWQNDFGNWQPYSPQISSFIESLSASNHTVSLGQVDANMAHYLVDLQNMCQIRLGGESLLVHHTYTNSHTPFKIILSRY